MWLTLLARWWFVPVIAALFLSTTWYRHEAAATKAEYAGFVAKTDAIGKAQEAAAKIKDAENKAKQEKANAENARTRTALTTALNGLRHSNPRGVTVPAAAASSKRPDLACYSRPELVGAVGSFVEAVRGLADEGSAGAVDLNTAKRWAQSK